MDSLYQSHIKNTVKMCNYFICHIRCVRKHLNLDASTALANALVSSRLDYCNSLLHSIPKVHLDNCNVFKILWPELSLSPLDIPAANHG